MGIINVGGKGTVSADGETYELDYKEALYLGRGIKEVHFSSEDSNAPSKFLPQFCSGTSCLSLSKSRRETKPKL